MEEILEDTDYSTLSKEEFINTVIKPLKEVNSSQAKHIKKLSLALRKSAVQIDLIIENIKNTKDEFYIY